MSPSLHKKTVTFSMPSVEFRIFENKEWFEYRRHYWIFVSVDRQRLNSEISSILSEEHRNKIKLRNGVL